MDEIKKKKSLIELTSDQDSVVTTLAKKHKMYKVDIIRKFIDMIDGLSGDIEILAYDQNNVRKMFNFQEIQDLDKDETLNDFSMTVKYNKGVGVRCDGNIIKAVTFGGHTW